jgi:hypothetical protein
MLYVNLPCWSNVRSEIRKTAYEYSKGGVGDDCENDTQSGS